MMLTSSLFHLDISIIFNIIKISRGIYYIFSIRIYIRFLITIILSNYIEFQKIRILQRFFIYQFRDRLINNIKFTFFRYYIKRV